MKPSGIGGQAIIEGVMMKNGNRYAVAVRKPNNEIVVDTNSTSDAAKKNPILKMPIIRGVVAFVESMSLGMKTLSYSASFFDEEEETSAFEKKLDKITKGHADSILTGITMVLAVVLAIGIFVVVPMLLAGILSEKIENQVLLAVLEGVFRLCIFIVYIWLISRMKDIQRMFMYHGAEHKSINCIENGLPLTVENVRKQSREHKRCGTSFMLNVMIISIVFFIFIRVDNTLLRFVVRLLLIPVIAGVSYEFIKLAGRSDNKFVNLLSRPGMWMQALTTKEPDDSMIEVAIASVEAVFDWKKFLEKETRKKNKKNGGKKGTTSKIMKEPVEEYATAAETEDVTPKAEEKPMEIDIAQLFDIKLTPSEPKEIKHGRAPKKDPMPEATQKVSAAKEEEEDDILKALDMYFEYKGSKSVTEISDEVTEEEEKK